MKVLRPAFVFQEGMELYEFQRLLATALLFSGGFYFDAAWLGLDDVQLLFRNSTFGLPRLACKGYVQVVTRVPRGDFLPATAPKWLASVRIWEWPTPVLSPERSVVNGFVVFSEQKWELSDNSVPFDGTKSIDFNDIKAVFADDNEGDYGNWSANAEFFAKAANSQPLNNEEHSRPLDRVLFWLETRDFLELLITPGRLGNLLGVPTQGNRKRIVSCERMRDCIHRCSEPELHQVMGECSFEIARSWNLNPPQSEPANGSFAVSLLETIGFLSSWDGSSLVNH
jgi:hypothetical protein